MPRFWPVDIPTALTDAQANLLYNLAEGKQVLEIGSLLGYSTITLAQAAKRVVSVDPHCGYPAKDPKPTFRKFTNNLARYGVRDKVSVCVGKHTDFVDLFEDESFGLVFIDADGTYETTFHILESIREKVEWSYGHIVVHDMGNYEWPGAESAVTAFYELYNYPWEMIHDVALIRRDN